MKMMACFMVSRVSATESLAHARTHGLTAMQSKFSEIMKFFDQPTFRIVCEIIIELDIDMQHIASHCLHSTHMI